MERIFDSSGTGLPPNHKLTHFCLCSPIYNKYFFYYGGQLYEKKFKCIIGSCYAGLALIFLDPWWFYIAFRIMKVTSNS